MSALLWKLALTERSTRDVIVAEGGVTLVLQAMQRHLGHPRLQYAACGALRHLLLNNSVSLSVGSQIGAARPGELPPLPPGGAPASPDDRRQLSSADAGRGRTLNSPAPGSASLLGSPDAGRERVPGAERIAAARVAAARNPRPSGIIAGGARGSGQAGLVRGLRASQSVPGLGVARIGAKSAPRPDSLVPSPPAWPDEAATPAAHDRILEQAMSLTLRSMAEHAESPLVQVRPPARTPLPRPRHLSPSPRQRHPGPVFVAAASAGSGGWALRLVWLPFTARQVCTAYSCVAAHTEAPIWKMCPDTHRVPPPIHTSPTSTSHTVSPWRMQEYGCGTLWNLVVAHPRLKTELAATDGVSRVLNAMEGHQLHPGVQTNGSAVLLELLRHSRLLQLQGGPTRAALVRALANHPYNSELVRLAEEVLDLLPKDAPVKEQAQAAHSTLFPTALPTAH